jgi:hypothetical protein
MHLRDVLQTISDFSDEATILVREPWTPSSDAIVHEFPVDLPVAQMTDDGRTYFLEVSVARDLIEDLKSAGWPDGDTLVERVVSYATNDA